MFSDKMKQKKVSVTFMSASDSPLHAKPTRLLLLLSFFFITNALIAEFIGVKIFSLEAVLGLKPFNFALLGEQGLAFNLTAGVLLWPFVFVMTDLVNVPCSFCLTPRWSWFATPL